MGAVSVAWRRIKKEAAQRFAERPKFREETSVACFEYEQRRGRVKLESSSLTHDSLRCPPNARAKDWFCYRLQVAMLGATIGGVLAWNCTGYGVAWPDEDGAAIAALAERLSSALAWPAEAGAASAAIDERLSSALACALPLTVPELGCPERAMGATGSEMTGIPAVFLTKSSTISMSDSDKASG